MLPAISLFPATHTHSLTPGKASQSPTSMLLILVTATEFLCQVREHGPRSEGQVDTLQEIL